MSTLHHIAYLIISIVFLSSCESNTFYCSSQQDLLKTEKEAPIIELNFNHTNETMLQQITSEFENLDSICNYSPTFYVPFDFKNQIIAKTSTATLIPFKVFNYCPDEIFVKGSRYNLPILINDANQVLMLGDYIKRDDFKTKLEQWYEGEPTEVKRTRKETNFSLTYDKTLSQDSLIADIQALTDAYFHCAERLAQDEFKSSICELSQKEVESLHKKMPFRIWLPLNFPLPPPPPPVE